MSEIEYAMDKINRLTVKQLTDLMAAGCSDTKRMESIFRKIEALMMKETSDVNVSMAAMLYAFKAVMVTAILDQEKREVGFIDKYLGQVM
jgi:hypothetical protein